MSIWNAFPFIRYSLALIVGIISSQLYPVLWVSPLPVFVILGSFIVATAFAFRNINLDLFRALSGFFTLTMFTFLGGFLALQHDESKERGHFIRMDQEVQAFSGMIISDHYESNNYNRYVFEVDKVLIQTNPTPACGLVYLYIRKDSASIIYPYGAQLFVNGGFQEIESPKNPDTFNYKEYLAHKNIFGQAFIETDEMEVVGFDPPNPVLAFAYEIRTISSSMISDFIPGDQEAAVLNALLIGVKDFLDNEIKQAYSGAGAMHVLAVSGLHVGIVYLLITLIFGQLKRTGWGRVLFVVISLVVIWCYALITGFSPSVMRASTMFSIIVMGESAKRKSNIYNSLGLAAFILLIYNPFFIYEVGFQLSFIAVFGIVMFQPPIYSLWNPTGKFLDYFWAIISVSIAAQLVTFPLSVYYFNQFPTYFLFSNIIVIPSAMLMLTTGLFMLMLGSFSAVAGEAVGFLLGGFVELVNWLILKIQLLPFPTIEWLYMSGLAVLFIYLFMIYLYQGLRSLNYHAIIFSLVSVCFLLVSFHLEDFEHRIQKRMVIYDIKDQLALDLINGEKAQLISFGDPEKIMETADYNLNPHRLVSGLQQVSKEELLAAKEKLIASFDGLHLITWSGIRILIIGPEFDVDLAGTVNTDILILQSFPTKLLQQFDYRFLVIGPMSSWWERGELITFLNKKQLKYHDLSESGFFELDLNSHPIKRN